MDDPKDRTLALFARSLVYKSTIKDHDDVPMFLTALTTLCYPPSVEGGADRPAHTIKAMLRGVPHRSGQVLLRSIANSFTTFDDSDKLSTMIFLHSLINVADLRQRSDTSLIKAISRAEDLLRNVFRSVEESTLADNPRDDILAVITIFLDKVQISDITYVRSFLRTCARGRADLFGFLCYILQPEAIPDYAYGEPNTFRDLFSRVTPSYQGFAAP